METRGRDKSPRGSDYFVICVIFYNAVIIYTNSIVTVCVFAEVAKFLDWSREFGQRTKKL